MPFTIIRGDLLRMKTDAVIIFSDSAPIGCAVPAPLPPGSAQIRKSAGLSAKWMISAGAPARQTSSSEEAARLLACCQAALALCADKKCRSAAFPLSPLGMPGCPSPEAARLGRRAFYQELYRHDLMVFLVLPPAEKYRPQSPYLAEAAASMARYGRNPLLPAVPAFLGSVMAEPAGEAAPLPSALQDELNHMDESFSHMLFRKIDEAGMTDPECYRRANLDRKLFSKIRSNRNYRPSKVTAVALALALRLPLPEFREFLAKAGYSLSRSSQFDIIVEFFVRRGCYDVFEIDDVLFACDQKLIAPRCRL